MDFEGQSQGLGGVEKPELNERQKQLLKQAILDDESDALLNESESGPERSLAESLEKGGKKVGLNPLFSQDFKASFTEDSEDGSGPRSKTSLRMNYEAQVSVIQKQIGNLEEFRLNLGLSQRKMAQLLMIDPSSWTRWTKKGDEAPPHIWRALQWFAVVQEKIPGLTPHYFNGSTPQVLHAESLKQIDIERSERQKELLEIKNLLHSELQEKKQLENDIKTLKKDLKFHRNISILVLSISLLWAGLFLFWNFL